MSQGYELKPMPIDTDEYRGVDKIVGIYDTANLTVINDEDFLAAPFDRLCPSGDCIMDCQNMTRVFQALPSGIQADRQTYGRKGGNSSITIFGVCTNLAQASSIIPSSSQNKTLEPFFRTKDSTSTNVTKVTNKIALCYASTCDLTREPYKCKEACAGDNFLGSPSRLNFNFANNNTGSLACISRLCDNTCGLPYANQDVLGVGVLTAYYVQVLTLILVSVGILISTGCHLWGRKKERPTIPSKLKSPLETFLAVQTYFGVSVAAASFVMNPAKVDALNGYALVAASIMGFLPPVFTLMLLHSHAIKSIFSTSMVVVSWLVNSVVFFILVRNLSAVKGEADLLGVGLQSLFKTTSCGGSSAMALCHQLTGEEPLAYLDQFFNKSPVPNIKTVPVLWGYTTVILAILVLREILGQFSKGSQPPQATQRPGQTNRVRKLNCLPAILQRPATKFTLLLLATTLFCFALGYEFRVVREYQKMDVIDKQGWSFGQVVAVLFLVPPVLDVLHTLFRKMRGHGQLKTGDTEMQPTAGRKGPMAYKHIHEPTAYNPNRPLSWNDGEQLLNPSRRKPLPGSSVVATQINPRTFQYQHLGDDDNHHLRQ